jgi:hypothetical protein
MFQRKIITMNTAALEALREAPRRYFPLATQTIHAGTMLIFISIKRLWLVM